MLLNAFELREDVKEHEWVSGPWHQVEGEIVKQSESSCISLTGDEKDLT